MYGKEAFIEVFGSITIADVVQMCLAIGFLVFIGKKVTEYLVSRHEAEKKKDEQLKKVLEAVEKYPEWRQQSVDIQKELKDEIQGIRKSQEKQTERLDTLEKDTKRRERNRIRESLLRNYRYFTSKIKNPMQAWTRMEADAFWEEYKDYTDAGGNGHVHEEVQPKMRELEVIEMYETERVTELMHSRG